jgi:hypothetical protein
LTALSLAKPSATAMDTILGYYSLNINNLIQGAKAIADHGFENKQKLKKVYKSSPLLAIFPEGPQKKFL